ncbi:MAG: polyprenyl synthetase family protein [bacterium]
MEIKEKLAQLKLEIDSELDRQLRYDIDFPPKIREALRYSVLNGGKRLRPILALVTGEMYGIERKKLMPVAVSLEYIQSFTLVHDDLPCMDDAELRRGKPTLHREYDEAIAVLAGDAYLNLAYGVIAREGVKFFPPELVLEVISELSYALGVDGVLGGQVIDLDPARVATDLDGLKKLHQMKTACFFSASLRMGAILAGAGKDDLNRLTEYAREFGLAFQITDDILDVTGSVEDVGKDVRHDADINRINYVSVHGLDGARSEAEKAVNRAKEAIKNLPDSDFLQSLSEYLLKRRK